jgi:hypothetical protein
VAVVQSFKNLLKDFCGCVLIKVFSRNNAVEKLTASAQPLINMQVILDIINRENLLTLSQGTHLRRLQSTRRAL